MTERRRLDDAAIARLLLTDEPYLSCDECFARIDSWAEASLADPAWHDPAMEAHLRGCGACAEEAEALKELLAAERGPAQS